MGRRGPQPKPAALHVLGGTFRPDRHGAALKGLKPAGDGRLPSAPDWLPADCQLWWERMRSTMTHRTFSTEDVHAFAVMVQMYAAQQSAFAASRLAPKRSASPGLPPQGRLWLELSHKLVQYFDRFGMSPAARTRIREEQAGGDDREAPARDEFADEAG